jgi:hypothetical protein
VDAPRVEEWDDNSGPKSTGAGGEKDPAASLWWPPETTDSPLDQKNSIKPNAGAISLFFSVASTLSSLTA